MQGERLKTNCATAPAPNTYVHIGTCKLHIYIGFKNGTYSDYGDFHYGILVVNEIYNNRGKILMPSYLSGPFQAQIS